ncbi:MAG: FG-GAP repeat protein [Solirubrobacteraceae bacterium]
MTQTAELSSSDDSGGEYFGMSVGISEGTIVVGAPQHQTGQFSDSGAAYVYTEPSGGWTNMTQTAELTASDPGTRDSLGTSVAVSGSTIVAGAQLHAVGSNLRQGAAYVFGFGSENSTGGGGNTGAGTTGGGTTGGGGTSTGPTPTPSAQVASVSGGRGKFTVTLSCPAGGAACAAGSLQATVKEHLKGSKITAITAGGKKKKAHATTKQVVVASGGVTLSAGTTKTLTLTLNSTGQALLSKFGKLTAIVTVSSSGKTIDTATVTVQKTAKPKKKK